MSENYDHLMDLLTMKWAWGCIADWKGYYRVISLWGSISRTQSVSGQMRARRSGDWRYLVDSQLNRKHELALTTIRSSQEQISWTGNTQGPISWSEACFYIDKLIRLSAWIDQLIMSAHISWSGSWRGKSADQKACCWTSADKRAWLCRRVSWSKNV